MKTLLTVQESKELINLGISDIHASFANESNESIANGTHKWDSVFTLTDLLNLMPKEIDNKNYFLGIIGGELGYDIVYFSYSLSDDTIHAGVGVELIDALYKALKHLIKNNYIKLD